MTLPRREQNRLTKERRILDAALVVFSETGFLGATMDAIAKAAGVSKPTLYEYFGAKENLFSAMLMLQRDQMLQAFEHPLKQDMVTQLYAFSWDYAGLVLRPDMLSLARLVIGEVQRFPEIGPLYQEFGPNRLLKALMDNLDGFRDAGRLEFVDTELAAQDLWGLILSAPRTKALYMPEDQPKEAELGRYISHGLWVFLKAYSTQPTKDLAALKRLGVVRFKKTVEA